MVRGSGDNQDLSSILGKVRLGLVYLNFRAKIENFLLNSLFKVGVNLSI